VQVDHQLTRAPLILLACGELSFSGSTDFGELSRAELAEVREGRRTRT
jgi:hypothetical protein